MQTSSTIHIIEYIGDYLFIIAERYLYQLRYKEYLYFQFEDDATVIASILPHLTSLKNLALYGIFRILGPTYPASNDNYFLVDNPDIGPDGAISIINTLPTLSLLTRLHLRGINKGKKLECMKKLNT